MFWVKFPLTNVFLPSNPNQVFGKERIHEAVWGYIAESDSNVIKENICKIRAKLMRDSGY
ncbi:MAG: helix-turn-helix domain-containing protein [Oscillospiraceae bacterium]|nr:helix-turn-helix domain-containing protein [Oscillospiraceae bacterium]